MSRLEGARQRQNDSIAKKAAQREMNTETPTVGFMVFAAFFYGICSGSMNFINKFVLTSWSFNQPAILILAQLPVLAVALKFLKWLGKIELVSYDIKTARSCALLSIFFCTNSIIALIALSGMNVPMYNALRRCIPLTSMLLGYVIFAKKPSFMIFVSVIIITIGAVVAASGDLNFDAKSYAMGVASAVLMSLQLLVLHYKGIEKHLSPLDLLYINSINCIPLTFLLCIGKFNDVMNYPHLTNIGFILSFFLVAVAGCILNYSMFLCTTVNSALTTTCVGAIKSGFTAVIGMYALGGVTPTTPFIIGQAINFLGGIMYACSKYKSSLVANRKADSLEDVKIVKT